MLRLSRLIATLAVSLLFSCTQTNAQGDTTVGVPPNAARISIPLGFVDALTGQVHLEIPIASVPERNGVPLRAVAAYDTTYYQQYLSAGNYAKQNGRGWTVSVGTTNSGNLLVNTHPNYAQCPANYPHGSITKYDTFRFQDWNLTIHPFPTTLYEINENCYYVDGKGIAHYYSPAITYYNSNTFSTDNQGYYISGREVWAQNGTHITTGGVPTDSNGNTGGQYSQNPITVALNAGTCTNTNSGYVYAKTSDGSTQTYTIVCQAYTVAEGADTPGTVYMPSSMGLPDGTQYTFTYDAGRTGVLTGVTLPTGEQVSFGYSIDSNYIPQLSSVTYGGGTWNFTGVNLIAQNIAPTTTVLAPPRFDVISNTNVQDETVYTPAPYTIGFPTFTQTVQFYSGSSTLLKTESMTYSGYCLASQTTTLNDTGQSSKVAFSYGPSCSLPTQKQEWDFGASTPTRTTKINYIQDTSSIKYNSQYHIYDRPLSVLVYAGDGTSGSPVKSTTYAYDEYSASYCSPMLTSVTGAVNHDDTNYSSTYWGRGNPTSITNMVSSATSVTSHACYNTLGNVTQQVDNAGNKTSFDYTERWADASCISSGALTLAFPTTITNPLGHRTQTRYYTCTGLPSAIQEENDIRAGRSGTTFTYDLLNRPLVTTQPTGATGSYSYTDSASAFSSTLTTQITGSSTLTQTSRKDSLGREVQSAITSDPSGSTYTATTYDALGHKLAIYNPTRCSPPTTNCGEATWGFTSFYYDALGRIIRRVPPDGTISNNNITTTYSGNCATVTDQVGKKRKSCSNAFGETTQIFQDPSGFNYESDYGYDVLDNLISVVQLGGSTDSTTWRKRTFTYDGLSRLVCASNPESSSANCPVTATGSYTPGTVGFTYDADGNLLTRTAPAPNQKGSSTVTVSNTYDALNRLTQKSYSDGTTPTIIYAYDANAPSGCTLPALTINNGIGKRTGMCDSAGAEAWSYDLVSGIGWKISDVRTTNGVTKSTFVQNNLADAPSSLTYPSGRVITYSYGPDGRPISIIDSSIPINYATNALYAPSGALSTVQNGGSLYSTTLYNSRLQPCWIYASNSAAGAPSSCTQTGVANAAILDFKYDFGVGVADNGDVKANTNRLDATRSQNFTYDPLNRLATAQTQTTGVTIPNPNCWGLTYGYDPWGNLLTASTTGPAGCSEPLPTNLLVNASNQIVSNSVAGQVMNYCYDAAGNLIHVTQSGSNCPTSGPYQYKYDAENNLISAGSVTYTYDGDGKRVQKSNGKLYWYGSGKDPLDETDSAGNVANGSFFEYVFFGGNRIARRDYLNNVDYYFSDYLGTAHVVTNAGGTILDNSDFYPYGGERSIISSSGNTYKFTGKEIDFESGLNYFGSRYFNAPLGRFMSPDHGPLSLTNPDSLNRYAYALNNPNFYLDPDGNSSWDVESVKLGKVLLTAFVAQNGGTFDPLEVLASLAGVAAATVPLEHLQDSQSNISGRSGSYSKFIPAPSAGAGGCSLPCVTMFTEVPNAVSIQLTFNYDDKTNAIVKTSINYTTDNNATFLDSNPPPSRPGIQPLPGWTLAPIINSIQIDETALKNLTEPQLTALFRATNGQHDAISNAIAHAVFEELRRRGSEAEEKAKEEERKKCASQAHTSCRATSNTDSGGQQNQ